MIVLRGRPAGGFRLRLRKSDGRIILRRTVPNQWKREAFLQFMEMLVQDASSLSNVRAGLIDASGFSGVSTADTHASHSGWVEFEDYEWGPGPSTTDRVLFDSAVPDYGTARVHVTTLTLSPFVFTSSGTIRGFFISNQTTKGSTAGSPSILVATGLISPLDVASSDELSLEYISAVENFQ